MAGAGVSKQLALGEASLAAAKSTFGAFWGGVPKFSRARLRALGAEDRALRLEFSQADLQDWSTRKYTRTVLLRPPSVALPSECVDARTKGVFWASAGARGLELRVVEGGRGTEGSDKEAVWIEVWDRDGEVCRRKVPGAKDVIVSGPFGEPRWSPSASTGADPDKVVFCIEKAEPKFARSFFEWKPDQAEGKTAGPADEADMPRAFQDKYLLGGHLGETLGERKQQGLIVFDWVADKFHDVSAAVKFTGTPLQPAFLPGGDVVFACVDPPGELARPGLSVCINRPTRLLCARSADYAPGSPREGKAVQPVAECLTPDLYFACGPTVSPDGSRILFFGVREPFATHGREVRLYSMDVASKEYSDVTPDYSEDFLGFFFRLHEDMQRALLWLPGSTHCAAHTFNSGVHASYILELLEGSDRAKLVRRLCPGGLDPNQLSVSVEDCLGSAAVVSVQGFLTPAQFHLVDLSTPEDPTYTKVFDSPGPKEDLLQKLDVEVSSETITTAGVKSFAWLLRHRDSGTKSRPLMVYIHGGPHVCMSAAFLDVAVCAVAAGFHVVLPNYRGSASFGAQYLECLAGHAGDYDVLDCYNAALHAKEKCKADRVVAYGGSHGGFMTGWLVGDLQYKDLFTAACLWNPASDLTALSLASDIPEWSICEAMGEEAALSGDHLLPATPEALARMHAASPISVARNVTCPALVVLGSGDVRCPWFMGLRWARSVELAGGDVAVLNYHGQGHAITGPECHEHAKITILAWLLSRLEGH